MDLRTGRSVKNLFSKKNVPADGEPAEGPVKISSIYGGLMKFLALTAFVSLSALAADPFKFEGHYSVDPIKCPVSSSKEFTRATIRSTSSEVLIQLYGEDGSTGLAIPSKSSKEFNPNFEYGNPVKYIITKSNCIGRILRSSVVYQYGNNKKETVETYRLERDGNKVYYREENKDGQLVTCELTLTSP